MRSRLDHCSCLLAAQDFRYASELGYAIKLLAIASKTDGAVQARVHPVLLHADVMLAKVDGVLNAVEIQTDLAGKLLFHGAGAGAMPTTRAALADIVDIARGIAFGPAPAHRPGSAGAAHGRRQAGSHLPDAG